MSTVSELTEVFTSKLGPDLFEKTGQFIEGIAPFFSLGLSLYVVLLTFYYYNRGLDESIVDISKRVLIWLVIIAFAFNAGNYTKIAGMIYALPDDLSSLFGYSQTSVGAVETGLQNIDLMVANLDDISQDAAWYEFSVHLPVLGAKFIVMIAGYWLFLLAFAFYLITKVCLALTLMIGPLFLGAALFPGTRQYSMNWIGQCLNYAVTIAMFTLLTVIQSDFVSNHVKRWVDDSATWNLAKAWDIVGQLLVLTFILTLTALSIPSIASALTGGAMADSHGRTVSRFTGGIGRIYNNLTSKGRRAGGNNRASQD